jgi:hypothetical protein
MNYEIIPLPEFERQVKRLRRKYRHIKDDLRSLQNVLLANHQAGDAISGLRNKVYKIRLAVLTLNAGKVVGFELFIILSALTAISFF